MPNDCNHWKGTKRDKLVQCTWGQGRAGGTNEWLYPYLGGVTIFVPASCGVVQDEIEEICCYLFLIGLNLRLTDVSSTGQPLTTRRKERLNG